MIKAAIIGATGYTGITLMDILLKHKDVEIKYITSKSYAGEKFSQIYPKFESITDLVCIEENINEISKNVDVIFMALPHGIASGKINNDILKQTKVIDLGADFRLKDKNTYETWYQVEHKTPELLNDSVYGLCELNREKIKEAKLIANPGCYTTASILALSPLVKHQLIETSSIIIDAKSGISGAGRSLNIQNLYCEANETIKAYKVGSHRHTVEIEQELSILNHNNKINLTFTPHLTPMNRGILATCYSKAKNQVKYEELINLYKTFYKNEFFIRIKNSANDVETKFVTNSNFVDIGISYDKRTNNIIVTSAIDNLIKGASGQAVQNMNIMFNLDESEGLK